MICGFFNHQQNLLEIEMACARIRELLERARGLDANDRPRMAEFAREEAVRILKGLEGRPRPGPRPLALDRRAA